MTKMLNFNKAVERANQASKGNYPETAFVVLSADEDDIPGNNYHVCHEFDLDTFFSGCEVLYSSDEN